MTGMGIPINHIKSAFMIEVLSHLYFAANSGKAEKVPFETRYLCFAGANWGA